MTSQEQDIAIFLACGGSWRNNGWGHRFLGIAGCDNDHGPDDESPLCEDAHNVPRYTEYLDEMHEAEKGLTDEERMLYVRLIANPFDTDPNGNYWKMWLTASASAAQRAEAFLKAKNLWTSS